MLLDLARAMRLFLTLIGLVLVACGTGSVDDRPVVVVNIGGVDGGTRGCIQPNFPDDEPDLSALQPPVFVTDNPNGQAVVRPGAAIEGRVQANRQTRQIFIELKNAWSDSPPIATVEISTTGGQPDELFLFPPPSARGRYYMKITLCGPDCDERMVVFDINPDVNSPYERTVIENRDIVAVDQTCVDVLPRATVLIQ